MLVDGDRVQADAHACAKLGVVEAKRHHAHSRASAARPKPAGMP